MSKKTGIEFIAEERQRQIEVEGYTEEHDLHHDNGELAAAGACYALWNWSRTDAERLWPFEKESFKVEYEPEYTDEKIKRLAKAGALMAAEIDRLENKRVLQSNKKGIL